MGEWCQYHAVNVGEGSLHVPCNVEGIVVGIARHTYDKVYLGGVQHALCLFYGADLCEHGWIAQSQLHILVVNLLLNPAVVFKHESIVGIGNYEYVVYASHHQIDERHVLEQAFAPLLWYIVAVHMIRYSRFGRAQHKGLKGVVNVEN